VAVGIYLPFELAVPIFAGGIISLIIRRRLNGRGWPKAAVEKAMNRGLLLASGLITGEALVGILMAIPIVVTGSSDVLAIADNPLGAWPGAVLLAGIAVWLLMTGLRGEEHA